MAPTFTEKLLGSLRFVSDEEEQRAGAFLKDFSALGGLKELVEQDEAVAHFCIVRRDWLVQLLKAFPARRLAICFNIANLPSESVALRFGDNIALQCNPGIPVVELCLHALATAASIFSYTKDALSFFLRTHQLLASLSQGTQPADISVIRGRLMVYSCFKLCRLGIVSRSSATDWSPMVALVQHEDDQVSLYAIRCLCHVLNMKPQWVRRCVNAQQQNHPHTACTTAGGSASPTQGFTVVDSSFIWADEIEQSSLLEVSSADSVQTANSAGFQAREATVQRTNTTVTLQGIEMVTTRAFESSLTVQASGALDSPLDLAGQSHSSGSENKSFDELVAAGEVPFVETDTSLQNLRNLALALCQPYPILVEGLSGSGKSLALRHMARLLGHRDVIELHLDSQMDSKTLLGSYVCTDTPGEFVWKAGVLTQAMQQGMWVVFEDLPSAPMEILSSILPLLEKGELTLPGRGLHIVAHPSFRVFGTYTIPLAAHRRQTAGNVGGSELPGVLGDKISNLFSRVVFEALPEAELLQVVQAVHKNIPPWVVRTMVRSFLELSQGTNSVGQAMVNSTAGSTKGASTGKIGYLAARFHRYGRGLSHRELFKWCQRTEILVRFERDFRDNTDTEFLTSKEKHAILTEAYDIFCAPFPWQDVRVEICRALARAWDVTQDEADDVALHPDPAVVNTSYMSTVTIGRVELKKLDADDPNAAARPEANVAGGVSLTRHTRCLITQIAACVRMREPLLLVGETGAGKTTIIQHLASLLGQKLVVQNLNVQTDSSDILGGFRPVQMRQLAVPVYEDFLRLIAATEISAQDNAKFLRMMQQALARSKWSKLCRGFKMMIDVVRKKIGGSSASVSLNGPQETASAAQAMSPATKRAKRSGVEDDDLGALDGAPQKSLSTPEPDSDHTRTPSRKRRTQFSVRLSREWDAFAERVAVLDQKRVQVKKSFAFAFVEGALVKALREGHWLLLDEINLAPSAALQRLLGLLDSPIASIALTERGDWTPIQRHPNFRLFAAMNPPTDFGKKALLPAMRNRFSELHVAEMTDPRDLSLIVGQHLQELPQAKCPTKEVVDFYLECRKLAGETLVDGQGRAPRFSLRTLSRSLSFARLLLRGQYPLNQAMYEGFCMNFLTQLDAKSRETLRNRIKDVFAPQLNRAQLRYAPPNPAYNQAGPEGHSDLRPASNIANASENAQFVRVAHFWVEQGPGEVNLGQTDEVDKGGNESFIVTPTVKVYLTDLARAAVARKYPVLLQGPTSSGKTSMVQYLAALTGHTCVRINNHEHTDLQEYIGSYVTNSRGQLVFSEGPLVQAVRKGHWIILDELNLAPSEVLEALNRLLDDNRELYVPELEEVIKPHPHFMLFATQNPPGLYGGRKVLSQAFRNRFLELNVDDIPGAELVEILVKRVRSLAPPFAECMVNVKTELERFRRGSDIFHGKRGFITPRDLLRWASRNPGTYEELASAGYSLLAERLRSNEEKKRVQDILEELCGRGRSSRSTMPVAIKPQDMYNRTKATAILLGAQSKLADGDIDSGDLERSVPMGLRSVVKTMHSKSPIAITNASARLSVLVHECLSNREPVLLVGATGSGKTTICQLMAKQLGRRLHIVNCHAHTDTADIIGSLRPVRNKQGVKQRLVEGIAKFCKIALKANNSCTSLADFEDEATVLNRKRLESWAYVHNAEANDANALPFDEAWEYFVAAKHILERAQIFVDGKSCTDSPNQSKRSADGEIKVLSSDTDQQECAQVVSRAPVSVEWDATQAAALQILIEEQRTRLLSLFEWHDGPLIQAMKNGDMILFDELALADDAVIERLNSVLENKRSVTISEKGADASGGQTTGKQGATEVVVAHPNFLVVATMNPGGDFGKRELSPALRNRFTEIWVPAMESFEDLYTVTLHHVMKVVDSMTAGDKTSRTQRLGQLLPFVEHVCQFLVWFNTTFGGGGTVAAQTGQGAAQGLMLTVRDALSWMSYMVKTCPGPTSFGNSEFHDGHRPDGDREWAAFVHGAAMSILDGMGLGSGKSEHETENVKRSVVQYLRSHFLEPAGVITRLSPLARAIVVVGSEEIAMSKLATASKLHLETHGNEFRIGPFSILRGHVDAANASPNGGAYAFGAATTTDNVVRIMRAMQLNRPLLLEGSPGVGKTSVVLALARASGHSVTRINLSEQTDIADLLGSDLPAPTTDSAPSSTGSSRSKEAMLGDRFRWCNGPLLKALLSGDWVILDELNLASQTVLEGLNSLLDHRSEVYIPELDQTFCCPATFRVFACQNPLQEGGGRKGLPKSFLNRFTRVHVAPLTQTDLSFIARSMYPTLQDGQQDQGITSRTEQYDCVERLIAFNTELGEAVNKRRHLGTRGAPWDFNLRDLFRWLELIQESVTVEIPCTGSKSNAQSIAIADRGTRAPPLTRDQKLALNARRFLPVAYMSRFREARDRVKVLELFDELVIAPTFADISGAKPLGQDPVAAETDDFSVTRFSFVDVRATELQIGVSKLHISTVSAADCMNNSNNATAQPGEGLLLPAQQRLVGDIIEAINHAWPVILVGGSSSGKTNALDLVADFAGKQVITIPLSSSVDASELLGCFEQSDAQWRFDTKMRIQLVPILDELASLVLQINISLNGSGEVNLGSRLLALCGQCLSIRATASAIIKGHETSTGPSSRQCSLASTSDVIEKLIGCLQSSRSMFGSDLRDAVSIAMQKAEEARSLLAQLSHDHLALSQAHQFVTEASGTAGASASFSFEWVDSVLLRAIERGDWVVLENVNHCSPSVLDRLNAFLEPEGELLINECGPVLMWDDAHETYIEQPRVVKAHKHFRMFMTMDPRYGTISRAFRNRCIELFVQGEVVQSDARRGRIGSPSIDIAKSINEASAGPLPCTTSLQRVVASAGFHSNESICTTMATIHSALWLAAPASSKPKYLPRHLFRWACCLRQLLDRGGQVDFVACLWRSFAFSYCVTNALAPPEANIVRLDEAWMRSQFQMTLQTGKACGKVNSDGHAPIQHFSSALGLMCMGGSAVILPSPQKRLCSFETTVGHDSCFPVDLAVSQLGRLAFELWLRQLASATTFPSSRLQEHLLSDQAIRAASPFGVGLFTRVAKMRVADKFSRHESFLETDHAMAVAIERAVLRIREASVSMWKTWLNRQHNVLQTEVALLDIVGAQRHRLGIAEADFSAWVLALREALRLWGRVRDRFLMLITDIGVALPTSVTSSMERRHARISHHFHSSWKTFVSSLPGKCVSNANPPTVLFNLFQVDSRQIALVDFLSPPLQRQMQAMLVSCESTNVNATAAAALMRIQTILAVKRFLMTQARLKLMLDALTSYARHVVQTAVHEDSGTPIVRNLSLVQLSFLLHSKILDKPAMEQLLVDQPGGSRPVVQNNTSTWVSTLPRVMDIVEQLFSFLVFAVSSVVGAVLDMAIHSLDDHEGCRATASTVKISTMVQSFDNALDNLKKFVHLAHEMTSSDDALDKPVQSDVSQQRSVRILLGLQWLSTSAKFRASVGLTGPDTAAPDDVVHELEYRLARLDQAMFSTRQTGFDASTNSQNVLTSSDLSMHVVHLTAQNALWVGSAACARVSASHRMETLRQNLHKEVRSLGSFLDIISGGSRRCIDNGTIFGDFENSNVGNTSQTFSLDALATAGSTLLASGAAATRALAAESLASWRVHNLVCQLFPEYAEPSSTLAMPSHQLPNTGAALCQQISNIEASVCASVMKTMYVLQFSEDRAASADLDFNHDPQVARQHRIDQAFVQALRNKLASIGQNVSTESQHKQDVGSLKAASEDEMRGASVGENGEAILLLRAPGTDIASQWADLQLAPLFLLESVRQEKSLFRRLLHLLNSDLENVTNFEMEAIERVHGLLTAVPSRPVQHLAVFTGLRWFFQHAQNASDSALAPRHVQRALLRTLVHDAIFHWHQTLWCDELNLMINGHNTNNHENPSEDDCGDNLFASVCVTAPASGKKAQRNRLAPLHMQSQSGSTRGESQLPPAERTLGPAVHANFEQTQTSHIIKLLDASSAGFALGSISTVLLPDGCKAVNPQFDFSHMGKVEPPSILAVADAQPKLHQMKKLVRFLTTFRDDTGSSSTRTDSAFIGGSSADWELPWTLFVGVVEDLFVFINALGFARGSSVANTTSQASSDHVPIVDIEQAKAILGSLRNRSDLPSVQLSLSNLLGKAIRACTHKVDSPQALIGCVVVNRNVSLLPLLTIVQQQLLPQCFELVSASLDSVSTSSLAARLWVLVGTIQLVLALPNALGDPLACKIAERAQLEYDLAQVEARLAACEAAEISASAVGELGANDAQPRCISIAAQKDSFSITGLRAHCDHLRQNLTVVNSSLALRSIGSAQGDGAEGEVYDEICDTLYEFLSNSFSLSDILELSAAMQGLLAKTSTTFGTMTELVQNDNTQNAILKEDRFQKSSMQLVSFLTKTHMRKSKQRDPSAKSDANEINFADVIVPVTSALYHIKHGLRMQRLALETSQHRGAGVNADQGRSNSLFSFPVPDLNVASSLDHTSQQEEVATTPLSVHVATLSQHRLVLLHAVHYAQLDYSANTTEPIEASNCIDEEPPSFKKRSQVQASTATGFQSIVDEVRLDASLSPELFARIQSGCHASFSIIADAWAAQTEAQRQAAWEAGRSFNIRKNRHAAATEIEDDEDLREQNFKQMFPNYHIEFADIVATEDTLGSAENMALLGTSTNGDEDSMNPGNGATTVAEGASDCSSPAVSAETVDAVAKLHMDIYGVASGPLASVRKTKHSAQSIGMGTMHAARWAFVLTKYHATAQMLTNGRTPECATTNRGWVDNTAHVMAVISASSRLSLRKSSETFRDLDSDDDDDENGEPSEPEHVGSAESEDSSHGLSRKRKKAVYLLDKQQSSKLSKKKVRKGIDAGECVNTFEVQLVEAPVRALMARLKDLQAQWPGHEVLQLLMRMCHRLLYTSVADPLLKTIAGVQLLLYKAQQWESYAAKHVSLDNELRALRTLMKRWRRIELMSWPRQLDEEQERFTKAARSWWPHLYAAFQSSLQVSMVTSAESDPIASESAAASECEQLMQQRISWLLPKKLQGSPSHVVDPIESGEKVDASEPGPEGLARGTSIEDVAARKNARWGWGSKTTDTSAPGTEGDGPAHLQERQAAEKFLSTTFELLDRFLRSPAIGEFDQRLALVAAFHRQQYEAAGATKDPVSRWFLHQSASVIFNVLHYYRQFVPAVERRISQARLPLEKRLRDHAKLSRWDDRTYYSLYESSEKAHRVIHKILLEFREALEMPVHMLLDESLNLPCEETLSMGVAGAGSGSGVFLSEFADVRSNSIPNTNRFTRAALKQLAAIVKTVNTAPLGLSGSSILNSQPTLADALLSTRFLKLKSIQQRMTRIVGNPLSVSNSNPRSDVHGSADGSPVELGLSAHADAIDQFTTSTIERWDSVKAAEVSRQMKQQALSSVLKQCRQQGLLHFTNSVPAAHKEFKHLFRVPVNTLGLPPPTFAASQTLQQSGAVCPLDRLPSVLARPAARLLGKGAEFYFRALPFVARARQLATGGLSKDLSLRESRQMLGFVEYSLFLASQQRFLLHRFAAQVDSFAAAVANVNQLVDVTCQNLQAHVRLQSGDDQGRTAAVAELTHTLTDSARNCSMFELAVCSTVRPVDWARRLESAQSTILGLSETLEQQILLVDSILNSRSAIEEQQVRALRTTRTASEEALHLLRRESFRKLLVGCQPPRSSGPAALQKTGFLVLNVHVERWNLLIADLRTAIVTPCLARIRAVRSQNLIALDLTDVLEATLGRMANDSLLEPVQLTSTSTTFSTAPANRAKLDNEVSRQLVAQFDELISQSMIVVQHYRSFVLAGLPTNGTSSGKEGCENAGNAENSLHCLNAHKQLLKNMTQTGVAVMTGLLQDISANLSQPFDATNEIAQRTAENEVLTRMLLEVAPLLNTALVALRHVFSGAASIFKSTAKMTYILSRATAGILKHGYGTPPMEDDGEGDGDDEGADKEFDGTGMGEGQGSKDVSDQIEDEEQLLGLKGEEQAPDQQDQQDGDAGVEMQTDFEGEMYDLKDQQPDDDEDDDDEQSEEDLDKEMQEFEGDEDEDVVDERLWDSDDEEEDKPEDQQDKFEEGEGVEGAQQTDELRSKEDDENNDDSEDKNKDKKDTPGEDGDHDEPEPENEAEDEDQVNNDYDDNYEEQHPNVDLKKPEDDDGDFELPDNLDDEDDGDEQPGEGEEEADDKKDDVDDDANDNSGDENENDADKNAQMDDPEKDEKEIAAEQSQNFDNEDDTKEDDAEDEAADDGAAETPEVQADADGADDQSDTDLDTGELQDLGEDGDEQEQDDTQDEAEEEEFPQSKPDESDRVNPQVGDVDPNTVPDVDDKDVDKDTGGLQKTDEAEGNPQEQQSTADSANPYELQPGEAQPENYSWHTQRQQQQQQTQQSDPSNAEKNHQNPPPKSQSGNDESSANAPPQWKKDLLDLDMDDTGDRSEVDDSLLQDLEQASELAVDERAKREVLAAQQEQEPDLDAQTNAEEGDGTEDNPAQEARDQRVGAETEVEGEANNNEDANAEDEDPSTKFTTNDYKTQQFASKIVSLPNDIDAHEDADADDSAMSSWLQHAHDMLERLSSREANNDSTNVSSLDRADQNTQATAGNGTGDLAEEAEIAKHDLADAGRRELEDLRQDLQRFSAAIEAGDASPLDSKQREVDAEAMLRRGVELWRCYEALTADASQQLCEQLRLVLEPMLATKLKGDYRTGKRINMRKVIPFIASQFQKDKIWLRRTAPNKRNYQVVVAIDDSLSMQNASIGGISSNQASAASKENGITPGAMACEAMTTICTAMTKLEVGELAVMSFGDGVRLLHPFDKQFTSEAAGGVMSKFTFRQESTDFCKTLESLVGILSAEQGPSGDGATTTQLVFLISDGHIDQGNRARVGKWVRHARQLNQLFVLIIVDPVLEDQRLIKFENGGIQDIPYMDDYPFPFYLVLKNLRDMPAALGDALRQWFELMQHGE